MAERNKKHPKCNRNINFIEYSLTVLFYKCNSKKNKKFMALGLNEKLLVAVAIEIVITNTFLMECISTKQQSFFISHSSVYDTNLQGYRNPILKTPFCLRRHGRQKAEEQGSSSYTFFLSGIFLLAKYNQIQSNLHYKKKQKLVLTEKLMHSHMRRAVKKSLLLKLQHGKPVYTHKGIDHKRILLWLRQTRELRHLSESQ